MFYYYFTQYATKGTKERFSLSVWVVGQVLSTPERGLFSKHCKCMQESATHHSTSSLKGNDDPKGSNSSVVEELLCCEENNWPLASQKKFAREHRQVGDGKRGFVYNCLIDWKRSIGFEGLSDGEMHHHLHITNIHYVITQSKSIDVCQFTADLVEEGSQHRKGAENAMRIAFEETILENGSIEQ